MMNFKIVAKRNGDERDEFPFITLRVGAKRSNFIKFTVGHDLHYLVRSGRVSLCAELINTVTNKSFELGRFCPRGSDKISVPVHQDYFRDTGFTTAFIVIIRDEKNGTVYHSQQFYRDGKGGDKPAASVRRRLYQQSLSQPAIVSTQLFESEQLPPFARSPHVPFRTGNLHAFHPYRKPNEQSFVPFVAGTPPGPKWDI
jgi:hypothetical protein